MRALVAAQAATIARQEAELDGQRSRIEQLRAQLARLRRMQFGRSSEKLDAAIAQLELALEDLEEESGVEAVLQPPAASPVEIDAASRPAL